MCDEGVIDDQNFHDRTVVVIEATKCHDGEVEEPRIDNVVAAWREEGQWNAVALPVHAADSMENLLHALRQFPGEGGVFGFVLVRDEFFLVIRVQGQHVRALVSDAMAVVEWPIAEEAMDVAEVPWVEVELTEFEPLGDLAIVSDLGCSPDDVVMTCTDEDAYPDEQLRSIADHIGLGAGMKRSLADAR